jgi:hypothetical protein
MRELIELDQRLGAFVLVCRQVRLADRHIRIGDRPVKLIVSVAEGVTTGGSSP